MAGSQGFWSYVHDDDEAEGGRISRLAEDVRAQFQMLTGESIELFLDTNDLRWGEKWRERIDTTLSSVAFFIPVLTPRYFMSPECRRELQFFARRSKELGIRELLLSVLYVDVPGLDATPANDDLMTLVSTFQYEDWRQLRFAEVTSEGYRRGVARLTERLVEANRRLETARGGTTAGPGSQVSEEDDSPGLLDRMATAEETLPKLATTIATLGKEIEGIGGLMQDATAEMHRSDSQGLGFAGRVRVARRLGFLLSDPVGRMWSSSNEFTSQLHDVDVGIRTIIELAAAELVEHPDSKAPVCSFFTSVRSLAGSTRAGLVSVQGMVDTLAPLERMSRDLRPVLRRLKQGLTAMVEAGEVADEWVGLIDRSGVECEADNPNGNAHKPPNPPLPPPAPREGPAGRE